MKDKTFLVFLLILLPFGILCNTLYVSRNTHGAYTTIQSAIIASAEGDTIVVAPGRYYENLRVISKALTIHGDYSPFSPDSLLITFVDGNQTGGCIAITDSSIVKLENLYLTNGSGFRQYDSSFTSGGGIFCLDSTIEINNCIIRRNTACDAGGVVFYTSNAILSGTDVSYNHSLRSSAVGLVTSRVFFDPVNLCSIYLNFGIYGNDISMGAPGYNIVLDKFTVSNSDDEFIYSSVLEQYTLSYQSVAVVQIPADLYVSPNGNDNNDGLSPLSPLKTIALAIIKIQADRLNPRIIHLADGIYSKSLNEQYYPLNMKSYVTIQGASEAGTILDGDHKYLAANGTNGEKDCRLKNMTIRNCGSELNNGVIFFNPRYYNDAVDYAHTRRPKFVLENLTFIDCTIPTGYPHSDTQWMAVIESRYAEKAVLKNISVFNCSGSFAINIQGGNTYAENILIDNYSFGNAESHGDAIGIGRNGFIEYFEGPNIFVNIRITNCLTNNNGTLTSSMFVVSNSLTGNQTPIENYLINSTINNNLCRWYSGSAITLGHNGRLTLINSIIYNNRYSNIYLDAPNEEPARIRILNSLVRNEANLGYINIHNPGANNIIEWYGTNLDSIPDFNSGYLLYPYSPNQDSPCIDAGTTDLSVFALQPDFVFPTMDLAGNPRIYGSQIDLGAYEWNGVVNQDENTPEPDTNIINIYPNPFAKNTTIRYNLKKTSDVILEVYNIKGQRVKRLVDARQDKGVQAILWDGKDEYGRQSSTGIYMIKLCKDNQNILSKKITLMQ